MKKNNNVVYMSKLQIDAGEYEHISTIRNIRIADAAYVFKFKEGKDGGTDRYQVYLQIANQPLVVIWQGVNTKDYKDDTCYLLPSQVWYKGTANYTPIHFALKGGQYNKVHEIALDLKRINKALKVYNCTYLSQACIVETSL